MVMKLRTSHNFFKILNQSIENILLKSIHYSLNNMNESATEVRPLYFRTLNDSEKFP